MSSPQAARPRARSSFAAAFLSLLFPGLGHAYAGAWTRALGFAAPPILLVALGAGVALRMDRYALVGNVLQNLFLIQVINVVVLVYRAVAAVDAYRVSAFLNASELTSPNPAGARLGRPRLVANPLSMAGLLAVLLVMVGNHAVIAYYDAQGQDLLACIFDPNQVANCDETASGSPNPGGSGGPTDSPEPTTDVPTAPPNATPAPTESIAPWNGTDRLNVLLIGADQRPKQNTFNTDTLIVASFDPKTRKVAMFSLPRDSIGVPLAPGPAASQFGTVPCKINSLWATAQRRPDLFPGNDRQRGFQAIKDTLGYLYNLNIQYYAEVNFDGFRQIVDAVGGVTINVQIPVIDDFYPGDTGHLRVYIPAGLQQMDGAEALIYARSRHGKFGVGSNDYDRAARQQRVLLSLKDQVDVETVIPKIPELIKALKSTVHTDVPIDKLASLLTLAGQIDTSDIRSFVFAPPLYGRSVLDPRCGDSNTVDVAKIRSTVRNAFSGSASDEATRQKIATEGATVWVLNGSGQSGQASDLTAYLEYQGITATAPNQRPPGGPFAQTKVVVYNGAEANLPETIKLLQRILGVQVTLANDPTARVNIVITTGRSTPQLTPPPGP